MDFNYQTYVKRYSYEAYRWPPDIGLAELHARCSETGAINENGVKCPCCETQSKLKMRKWWKRDVSKDFSTFGSAIPGYFQLIKFYAFFCISVLLINSIYPIYATYYVCDNFPEGQKECLQVAYVYYLDYNTMIQILQQHHKTQMINILQILQTAVFYVLLLANYLSIFFITFFNDSAKLEIKESQENANKFQNCLLFYNVPEPVSENFKNLINLKKVETEEVESLHIVKAIDLYEIKNYYSLYNERCKVYYRLLSNYVEGEDPYKMKKINKKLMNMQEETIREKQKIGKFNGKMVVLFDDRQSKHLMHRIYKIGFFKKWYYGLRTLLKQMKLCDFDPYAMDVCSFEIRGVSGIKWENLGEPMGIKMATRIKTFFVALIFIGICYVILSYPILISLKTHIKETKRFTHLNTFEKVLPGLISILLVAISIVFRGYMQKLSDERNPRDEVEKSTFVLLSTVSFHIVFYILIPTFFFMYPNDLSSTVKLYVIEQQARTFILIQLIIIIIDLPYKFWKDKKIKALSDQRYAFRENQMMLHKTVESRDYPLEIRLQVLFRIWSLVLFYSFFLPYMVIYIIIAFFIIFWIEKRNLYKHYTLRRKISIKLLSEVLVYFVNFFCVYLCIVYCFNVMEPPKIIAAVVITFLGLVSNIVYWIVLNKAEESPNFKEQAEERSKVYRETAKSDVDESVVEKAESLLLRRSVSQERADEMTDTYLKFLESIQNSELDEQINKYLNKYILKQNEDHERRRKSSVVLELTEVEKDKSSSDDSQQMPDIY